jgi:hypothetical protein
MPFMLSYIAKSRSCFGPTRDLFILNNPQNFIDPSGYFFGKLFKNIFKWAFRVIFPVHALANHLQSKISSLTPPKVNAGFQIFVGAAMLLGKNPAGLFFIASGATAFGDSNGWQMASGVLGLAGVAASGAAFGGTGGLGGGPGNDSPGGFGGLGVLMLANALAADLGGKIKQAPHTGKTPQMLPGVDLAANVKEAQIHAGMPNPLTWFKNQVTDGGPWDYKKYGREYEDFGNWHYGIVGKAMGIPDIVLLNEAGINSVEKFGTVPGWGYPGPRIVPWLGKPPYGDDPRDQSWITSGMNYYRQHYGQ